MLEAGGADHVDVARDLTAIGALHHDAGDAAAAETAYRRALEIFEKFLGPEHYEVGMTCANLAVSTAPHDAALARRLYERATDILERALGAVHPDVATRATQLRRATGRSGRYGVGRDTAD